SRPAPGLNRGATDTGRVALNPRRSGEEIVVAIPAKAGTHSSATLSFSSSGNILPIFGRPCRGTMGPGLRRGGEKNGQQYSVFTRAFAAMTEEGAGVAC